MARAIGLDIGERFLKVVELVGSPRSFRVQAVAIREIPLEDAPHRGGTDLTDDLVIEESGEIHPSDYDEAPARTRDQRISDLLSEVFTSMKLAREDVCAAFPSHYCVNREILVPFFEEDQIRKVVRFEAENHLHSHAIDDVVVNWIKTGETKDGSRLTIFAAPKMALATHMGTMRRARVDPASVDLDATAIYTALEACGVLEKHPNVIVVEVGANASTLMLLVGGRPRVMRSFRLGVGSLEAGVGAELGVDRRQGAAHVRRRTDGDLLISAADAAEHGKESEKSLARMQTDVVTDQRSEFITKLHRETVRSLASVSTDTPPDRILIIGGGALIPSVASDLSERFGLPVERLNILDHVECKDSDIDREFAGSVLAPAIGCGLRMLGRNPLGVELLRDEFAPRNTFEVVRTTLATTITLLFLVLGVWVVGIKDQLKAERRTYEDMADVVGGMTFKTELAYLQGIGNKSEDVAKQTARNWLLALPRDERRIQQMRSLLIQRHRFLQSELGLRSDITKLPSALKVMYEMYKALSAVPREDLGTWFRIEDLTIQERRAIITLTVDDRRAFDTVRRVFSESPYFRDRASDPRLIVEPGPEQSAAEGRRQQRFTFVFREE
ncbi:MAG: hypothetical protein O2894_04045 [Planctomycetota bacterium]|nr:hypothetical protein [Planctomycetota bacterium]